MQWYQISRLLESYGIPLALVLFFIWRDYQREALLNKKVSTLEKEMRDILKELLVKSTNAMANIANSMTLLAQILNKIPCLPDLNKKEFECKIKEDIKNLREENSE